MWVSLKGFEFCGDLSFGEVEVFSTPCSIAKS